VVGQTISHYQVVSKLGEGGMGVVYLAQDTMLGRRVAIKMLNVDSGKQHYRQRFLREARAVSALNHPNLAVVYDYGETLDGKPFIVMEFVEGRTLEKLLKEETTTLSRILEIIECVAKALSEAHRRGIVHRDIKPSNIIISERGDVKVLDFGLAKSLSVALDPSDHVPESEALLLTTQTREGVVIGTPMYLSPEQALGASVDARSDIFSLGSVLYECIGGRPPFDGASAIAICTKVIRDNPPPPSHFNREVPPVLDQITLKLLAKRPEDRYQSTDELLADLKTVDISSNDAVQVLPPPITSQTKAHPARTTLTNVLQHPRYLMVAFLLAVVVGVAGWRITRLRVDDVYVPRPEAEKWYLDGTNALRDGTYYQSSKRFEEAISLDDKYALAHAHLAESLAELGYVDRANSEISRANMLVTEHALKLSETDLLYLKAINATVSRDFDSAIESYKTLTNKVPAKQLTYVYVDLGRAYEKSEDLKKALESYQEAIRLDSQNAAAFLRSGVLYGRQQDFKKAEECFSEAYRLYQTQTNMEGVTETLYQRGSLYIGPGNLSRATGFLEDSLNVSRTIASISAQIKALFQLSRVAALSGNIEQAKVNAVEAISLAQSNNISGLAAQGQIDLGNTYFVQSKIDIAESYYKAALSLAQAQNMRGLEARASLSLGSLYVQQDDPDRGLQLIKQALPFYGKGLYRNELLQAQNLLGQANDLKGNYDQALEAFSQQLQLAQQVNNKLFTALAHKGMGTALAHQERYSDALNHIEESYSIYSSLNIPLHAGYALLSRADVLWRLGRYEEARAALGQATAMAERPDGKFKQLWGRLYVVSAPMALSQRRFADAISEGRRAISHDESETKYPSIETQYTVGLAQSISGSSGAGHKSCEDAVQKARSTGNPRLLAGAQLALAEAALISRNWKLAITNAKEAQQLLERSGQKESEWRAWLMAGLAAARAGDLKEAREYMARANAELSSLRQRWNDKDFKTYLLRPDIGHYEKLLRENSAYATSN
jgi:serine/threonine protein kinase/tetratricopeptide (TPR) repeat protein